MRRGDPLGGFKGRLARPDEIKEILRIAAYDASHTAEAIGLLWERAKAEAASCARRPVASDSTTSGTRYVAEVDAFKTANPEIAALLLTGDVYR